MNAPSQPVAQNAPASLPENGYKLDWKDIEIKLAGGRSVTLRRPTQDEILKRDGELQSEIPIGTDGSYALPDPTINEETDAKYFDLVKISDTGFADGRPLLEMQKAKIFNELYAREIYVDEDYVLGDEPIPVLEEIGKGVEPDHTIMHLMRVPAESEIKQYRRKSAGGELRPGKRGRQKFVTQSNLRTAMSFYASWMVGIEGATVAGESHEAANHAAFVDNVDPLIQRQVVNAVVEMFTAKLSD